MIKELYEQAKKATEELVSVAKLKKGDLVVVGCSSSEIGGSKIGTDSNLENAESVFAGIYDVLNKNGIFLAAQCCEHLNRALIIEADKADIDGYEQVNAIPQPKAGGSFGTTAYRRFKHPVAVEEVKADAGLDIGGTLIGMHLKKVAVPVRLSEDHIGRAILLAARVRPKYVGGQRAVYDESLE